ncbi:hypothetical protein HKB23_00155, partial [Vibrio parahaemolyticus]|nr:hypothetical protein [Vibrio parahaemolyticus]
MSSILLTLPVVLSLSTALTIFFVRRSTKSVEWLSGVSTISNLLVAGFL